MSNPIITSANESAATKAIAPAKKVDWRTKEARAARAAQRAEATPATAMNRSNKLPYVSPEIATAAHMVDSVQGKCDSVRRKLAGGSVAVTSDDLECLERELLGARLKLGELSPKHPQALLHARQ